MTSRPMMHKPSVSLAKIAQDVSLLAGESDRLEREINHAHAMLDHLGVAPAGDLTERITALGQFVVRHHGQWSSGTPCIDPDSTLGNDCGYCRYGS